MISGLHVGGELRRFHRSKLGRVAILAIILIPLLYSALYLWAFWDPFSNLKSLPIAFVNDDEGAIVDGQPLQAGDRIVDSLGDQDQINFTLVDNGTAQEGVRNGDYYFVVRLTPDFSQSVASISDSNAHPAVIETNYNSANGYLSTMIGENVMRTLVPTISNELGANVVDKVLVGIQDAGTGLDQAADGASKLHDGADDLKDGLVSAERGVDKLADKTGDAAEGAGKLAKGAKELDKKAGDLATGADKVAKGASDLDEGVDTAAGKLNEMSDGVDKLHDGLDELSTGADQIDDGVQKLTDKVDALSQAQSDATTDLETLAQQLAASPIPQVRAAGKDIQDLADKADKSALGPESQNVKDIHALADGTAALSYQLGNPEADFRKGFDSLHEGTGKLPKQVKKLTDGTEKLKNGTSDLADGAHALDDQGTSTLATKSKELSDGLVKLEDGADKLNEKMPTAVSGAKKLVDGAHTLAEKLDSGAQKVPVMNAAQRSKTADLISNPTSLNARDEAGPQTFGTGLAPFFFSLAMFIGGMITFLLLRPLHNRAVAAGVSPLRAAWDGLWPGALIGMAQASAIVAVTLWGVGLNAAHPVALWLFCLGVSVMFVAVNQMLNVALGPGPGKVLAMALLMLQILSSNGLYPVETEPKLFSWLHPINPMTYSINGFRQLMYGNIDHRLLQAVLAVAFITAIAVAVTSLCARRNRTWTMKRLHPPIDV